MRSTTANILKSVILLFVVAGFTTVQAQSVMQKLKEHQETSNFAQALEKADISDRLNGDGPFTLFAPSNNAFGRLSVSQQANSNLLLNHIFTGMATERSLRAMSDITCLSGQTISVATRQNRLSVNNHAVVVSNIRAKNGVIHIIDGVIQ